ncbi:hypothetical protein F0357_13695 [Rhizobiales bacterium Sp-1]|uniref:Uncharacterized protein n=1 Tax=Segnochrobactrum spirostomi TaxID=2608987 RepID=A0A6A7Y4L5_9HYPH|nr:hypothetical protein [Segnochrobactrum spirostomi]
MQFHRVEPLENAHRLPRAVAAGPGRERSAVAPHPRRHLAGIVCDLERVDRLVVEPPRDAGRDEREQIDARRRAVATPGLRRLADGNAPGATERLPNRVAQGDAGRKAERRPSSGEAHLGLSAPAHCGTFRAGASPV